MDVTLKYCEVVSSSFTAGSTSHQAFRANSIFDPNLTGTGHQPLGRDQLAEMYQHYEVLNSQLKVTIVPTVYTAGDLISVAWLDDDGSTAGSIQQCMEQPSARWVAVSNYNPTSTGIHLSSDYNSNRDFGPGEHMTSDMGGNPSNQMYHMIAVYSSIATTFDYVCEVTYRVRFSQPVEIASS